jgi:hypothetical protein
VTPTLTVTATSTATVTATTTPTESTPTIVPTSAPKPVFLPLALREHCTPPAGNIDVVFVLDGSSYMRKLRRGLPAWETGLDMIRSALAAMDFDPAGAGQDQAGFVVVRHQVEIRETLELSTNRDTVLAELASLEYGSPSDTNRLDVGLVTAVSILERSRMSANRKVIVFVSELQPKNVPYRNEPGCEEADENCTMLKRASEVKARGITLVIFATGDDNRGPELLAMATLPQLALVLPSNEQIHAIIQGARPMVPCDPGQFWPRRP